MKSLCSKCNRAVDYSDMFRLTRCSFHKNVTTVRFNCNEFIEKSVDMSTDAEAQKAINLLLKKGYSMEQVQAAWRILDNNQQEESVNDFKHLRVQRKRTKGYRQPDGCISVARPSMWGNPFETAAEYRKWLTTEWQPDARKEPHWKIFRIDSMWGKWNYTALDERKHWILTHFKELCGKQLSCFCSLEEDCHADVLIDLANK